MRKHVLLLIMVSIFFCPALLQAEDFLGAPVIPQGETIKKTRSRLVIETSMSHDQVLAYYQKALEDFDNIKYREWEDETYIEDDGSRPWHSITISKGGETGTRVAISKDSWTWIMGTLLLRFIAVFVVLIVLFLGMSLSGKILYAWANRGGSTKTKEKDKEPNPT